MEATYTPPPNAPTINLPAYDIVAEMEQAETHFSNELTKWFR